MRTFIVCFFVDTDKAVETYSERVEAKDSGEAWDKAVAQARASGTSRTGHGVPDDDWGYATEVATIDLTDEIEKARTFIEQNADYNDIMAPLYTDLSRDDDENDLLLRFSLSNEPGEASYAVLKGGDTILGEIDLTDEAVAFIRPRIGGDPK